MKDRSPSIAAVVLVPVLIKGVFVVSKRQSEEENNGWMATDLRSTQSAFLFRFSDA